MFSSFCDSDTPSRLNENVTPQQRRKSLAQQNIKYQNTYKLEPDKRFLTHKVEHLMEQVVLVSIGTMVIEVG